MARFFLHATDSMESLDQTRAHFSELAGVIGRKLVEYSAAFLCHRQNHAPGVFGILAAGEQTFADRTVDQLDNAMVLQAKPLGRVGDCRERAVRFTGDLQQQLVLLRLHACMSGRALAIQ